MVQHKLFGRLIECHEYRRGKKLKNYNKELWKRRIYIKGIPFHYKNIDLKNAFNNIGVVKIASILKKEEDGKYNGKSGFVTFFNEEDAMNALDMRNFEHDGNNFVIFKCFTKEETERFKKNQGKESDEFRSRDDIYQEEEEYEQNKSKTEEGNNNPFYKKKEPTVDFSEEKVVKNQSKTIPKINKSSSLFNQEDEQLNEYVYVKKEKLNRKRHPLAGKDFYFEPTITKKKLIKWYYKNHFIAKLYLNHILSNLRLNPVENRMNQNFRI